MKRGCLVLVLVWSSIAVRADPGPLSLRIVSASVSPFGSEHLVEVRVRAVNRTGAAIVGHTNFGSILDGLSLVVRDARGREVLRRPYVSHQSPYEDQRRVELAPGSSEHRLVFPVPLPRGASRIRLEGTLAGRADLVLRSDEARIRISRP